MGESLRYNRVTSFWPRDCQSLPDRLTNYFRFETGTLFICCEFFKLQETFSVSSVITTCFMTLSNGSLPVWL